MQSNVATEKNPKKEFWLIVSNLQSPGVSLSSRDVDSSLIKTFARYEGAFTRNWAEDFSIVAIRETKVFESWLAEPGQTRDDGGNALQTRLHKAAACTFGTIRGGNPNRSQNVRRDLQSRLEKRRGR